MRNIQIVQLHIPAYTDDDGEPACALDFPKGLICPMYRQEKCGTVEKCGWTEVMLDRRKDGRGTLIPCSKCPVHVMEGV